MEYINIVSAFSAVMALLTLMGIVGLIRLAREKNRKAFTYNYCDPKNLVTRIDLIDQGGVLYTRELRDTERLLITTLNDGRTLRVLIGER